MERAELLEYLEFAQENNYVLDIMGVTGKRSKVLVDSYSSIEMEGRFYRSNKSMSFKYDNIVSCHFTEEKEQKIFEQRKQGKALYGEKAEYIERRLEKFKNYYKQIIEAEEEEDELPEGKNAKQDGKRLKKQKIERIDNIFNHTYLKPDSLLLNYFLGEIGNEDVEKDIQPILLLSRSNFSQKQAIENALIKRVSIIEGPPGTGKTTTILSIVANLFMREKRVVVVSKNNSAIDNIKEELDKLGLPPFYLRLGRQEVIEKQINPNIKLFVQEALRYANQFEKENDKSSNLRELYNRLQILEEDINRLIEKKNRLQEAKNMLRHIEKRREAFQIQKEFPGIKKFQNRSIESMRREIDRIAYSLQQLDYENQYSLWSWLKNSFIWKMDRTKFETEGLLLQFQLEYLYLVQEIQTLSEELKHAGLEDKQKELKKIYDEQYVDSSVQLLEKCLSKFFASVEYHGMANQIIDCTDTKIYSKYKEIIHELYPVILTTADALVYNFSDFIDNNQKIDYIIMDEASQCDLLTGIPVLHLAKRCVIVGDQKQLSAITGEVIRECPEVEKEYDYFSENLLSSVKKVWDSPSVLLREHYRCDYSIINYCNKFFYDNELIIYTESNPNAMEILRVEQGKYAQSSLCNEREIKSIEEVTGKSLEETYVITPFRKQGEMLREYFQCGRDTCGTIHTFQGRGQKNVFFSTVLNDLKFANAHLSGSHCLFQNELLNVAVSRAKKHFVLVSDASYLRKRNLQMRDLIDYIESYGREIPDTTVCIFDGLYSKMKAYTKHDNLDNIFEETVYNYIESYCSKHSPIYCRLKLPLADLVTDKKYLDENADIRKFVLHHNAHVDFTLCNAVNKPVLVIELDGERHKEKEQIERDEKKNHALRHMRIPLWRLSSKKALTKDEFEQEIEKYIKKIS